MTFPGAAGHDTPGISILVPFAHDLPLDCYHKDMRGGLTHPPSGDLALEAVGRNAIEGLSKYTGDEQGLAEEGNG